jgi:NTP pyrophosphatase (non-canonical NTP hydrolase)
MADDNTTIGELRKLVAGFISERKWEPYHSPKNLAGSISIEAAELMELFQWEEVSSEDASTNKHLMARIKEEAADIMIYIISLANALDMDLSEAVATKVESNRKKFPV